jgi:hypothetical protein
MEKLFIDGRRSGYTPESSGKTMTVGDLVEGLNNLLRCGDVQKDTPIYLVNDNGYTFGNIDSDSFYYGEDFDNADQYSLF